MLSDTPPSRVKKAWRMRGSVFSSGASISMKEFAYASSAYARKSGQRPQARRSNRQDLEQRAHGGRSVVREAPQRGLDFCCLRGRRPGLQCPRARLDAESVEEIAL